MTRTAAIFAGLALLLIGPASTRPSGQTPPALVTDLVTLFGPAGIVRDVNNDGLPDSVAARVIVPAAPSVEEATAAANVAARLGFETTAFTLPVVLRDRDVAQGKAIELPILLGRSNSVVQALLSNGELSLAGLAPGQGLIAVVRSPLGGADGMVIVGGDDKGTLAAANVVAARLPRLWNMTGITLAGVADQVSRYLSARGITSRPLVTSVLVDSDRRGLAQVTLRAPVSTAALARAEQSLTDLDRMHRRGLEPQTLNFAEIAKTTIVLWADARTSRTVDVFRAGLNPRTLTPPIDPNELATDSPGERGRPAEDAPGAQPARPFDLASAFSLNGWFGDGYVDLIPDRADTTIVVGSGSDALSAAHIAARLGLETTGITLPIARPEDDVRDATRERSPILVGRDNRLVRDLVKVGRAELSDLQPGEGAVQIVPRAFGNLTATVIAGADDAGTEAASRYLSRHVPYVWDIRRGAVSLVDLKGDVTRFLAARSGAAQAAQALAELDTISQDLRTRDAAGNEPIEALDLKVWLESADRSLDAYLTETLKRRFDSARVTVVSEAMTAPTSVIDETMEIPWEVDEFWKRLRADVLPKIRPGSSVDVEARLSESPELRTQLADQTRLELLKAGAKNPGVRILSAYKQGYLWLTEQVIPDLKGKGVRGVHIRVAEHKPDFSKKYKFYQVPSRWVHELYPVDDIMLRELGVTKDQFSLELVADAKDIYTVEAFDSSGKVVDRRVFNPRFYEREYLDKFPGWSRVDVTTGWIAASVDGQVAVDARIATDPERFWDEYQARILPRIYDHVMKVTENRPLPDKQPFHRDLDIEVRLSEPDFRIGIDEELVSSLEALHEDLYFVTLDFFDALGRTTTRRRLAAPGKIFPIIHPERRGKPGTVRVSYAGNASARPQLELRVTRTGAAKPETIKRELTRIETSAPQAVRAVVRADGVSEIELVVEPRDDREAGRAVDAIDALSRLHAAGLYKTSLSYEKVDRLAITVAQRDARRRHVIKSTGASAPSNVHLTRTKPNHPVVTWDHVIGPDESESIVAALAAYPEVSAYRAGVSYRGRPVSVLELTLPSPGEQVSLAKLTALKPTILITGRQHANEVSSTSHILRLGELIATDPAYRDLLKKVNVILHPVENPDGAQMAFELQKLTPTHMLHAGRYSALGMDVASQVGLPDPLLPEALVRERLWRDWLPDIYLNPHGYPSHEWVQPFAGYVPPGFRTYLSTRGWWTNVSGLRDPRYPEHAQAVASLREAIVREVNANPDVRDMNLRSQARYRRWAYGFAPYVFAQEIYKETAIYYSDMETGEPRGRRRAGATGGGGEGGGGRFSMNQWPQVTFMSGMTESPDETAQGKWLELATKPGFSFLMAHLKYLRDGHYAIERIEEDGQRDSTTRTLLRPRPVRPASSPTTTNGTR